MEPPTILRWHTSKTATVLLFVALLGPSSAGLTEKLTPEEVVQRHLGSIGSSEARANLKSRILRGHGFLRILQGGSGGLPGVVTHISEGHKSSLLFDVDNPSYRGEQIVFDGEEAWVTSALPGQRRSGMGEFVYTHNQILQEGLLGGTLSTGWALLALDSKRPNLKYRGLKKVNERELHRLEYRPKRRGGDLQIDLFFEPETFRHVQTTYRLTIPAQMGATPIESARQQLTYYLLEESFDNFQEVDGLTLPARWRIRYSRTGQPAVLWEWEMLFQSCTHNQAIDPESFRPR